MKRISLTQGQFAIVSDKDYKSLIVFKWHALKLKHGFVACRMEGLRPNRIRVYMHRQIMGAIDLFVDHKNHNTLDNRRNNLRFATPAQNRHNSRPNNQPKSSRFLGVSFDQSQKLFVAQISIDGRPTKVGRFKDEITAAIRYNKAAKKHYGEFAYLNDIKPVR